MVSKRSTSSTGQRTQISQIILKGFLFCFSVLYCLSLYNPKEELHKVRQLHQLHHSSLLKQHQCLTELLWYESNNQSKKGIKAVLSVVQNRVNSRMFPSTFCEVAHQYKQFSYRNRTPKGIPLRIKVLNQKDREVLRYIQGLSYSAVTGGFTSTLEPSVLFYTRKEVYTPWMDNLRPSVVIQDHKFFKI